MNETLARTAAFGLVLCGLLAGCDMPVPPPMTANSQVPNSLAVLPNDQAELDAVTATEKTRVNYRYRLLVLQSFYERTGNLDKKLWADREIENLDKAHTFGWENAPDVVPPKGESLAQSDEQMLVEYVVGARREYLKAMTDLLDYYKRAAPGSYKAQRVANVLDRFDPVRTYTYFLGAEMPGPEVRPTEVIPQADRLYEEALRLYEEGKGILRTFVTTDYRKERQALMLLLDLVRKYPRSTKIAQAAFYIGEIYKEYFNENIRAVHWYERAWQWDANITLPARFQAAVVNDFRLFNRAKAVELYRQVILHEQFSANNVRYAHQRIRELTGS